MRAKKKQKEVLIKGETEDLINEAKTLFRRGVLNKRFGLLLIELEARGFICMSSFDLSVIEKSDSFFNIDKAKYSVGYYVEDLYED